MHKTIPLLVASIALLGCNEGQRVIPTRLTDRATLEAMYQEIRDLTQDRTCQDTPECAALPLGSKPCGGPWTYLVYSKSTVNEVELQARVLHLGVYEAQYNEEYHVVSDCSLATAPNPACVNSVCVDSNQSP